MSTRCGFSDVRPSEDGDGYVCAVCGKRFDRGWLDRAMRTNRPALLRKLNPELMKTVEERG